MILTISQITRITGLDPANLYVPLLKASDATFVDIIHTNPGVMGTNSNSGTVDFWPNKNSLIQPGCPIIPLNLIDCKTFFKISKTLSK